MVAQLCFALYMAALSENYIYSKSVWGNFRFMKKVNEQRETVTTKGKFTSAGRTIGGESSEDRRNHDS